MNPTQEVRIGGRYLLRGRVAAGGMGEVWRAEDDVLGRTVAVKMLKAGLSGDSEFVARFRAEARNAARLANGHIAQLHDYGESGGTAYLVMEFVDGRPLSQIIRAGAPLPIPRTVDLLAQCCDALGAAHAKGIVHRDVKPANIVVTDTDTAKLTDFGIARAADNSSLTRAGEVMGTPMYLAPEAAMGREATGRSDLYSLAVVGYQMLTGRLPFEADSAIGYAVAHVNDTPAPLPLGLPVGIRDTIMQALEKDPSERPRDMREFASLLRTATDGAASATVATALEESVREAETQAARIPLPHGDANQAPTGTAPEPARPASPALLRVGANTALREPLLHVHVDAEAPLDLVAFELSGDDRVPGDDSFVFYNQTKSGSGAVRLMGGRLVEVDTAALPRKVASVVVGVAAPDDRPVSHGGELRVLLADGERRLEVDVDRLATERAAVLLRIYRRGGGWKARNLVSGWEGGLRAMVDAYGVDAAD